LGFTWALNVSGRLDRREGDIDSLADAQFSADASRAICQLVWPVQSSTAPPIKWYRPIEAIKYHMEQKGEARMI
jgi:hypothetical protein